MIALSGLVFSLTFVMVQFSATPTHRDWCSGSHGDRILTHAFGTFTATFLYAVAILAWTRARRYDGGSADQRW
jgi:uncharacterized membrane protein